MIDPLRIFKLDYDVSPVHHAGVRSFWCYAKDPRDAAGWGRDEFPNGGPFSVLDWWTDEEILRIEA